MKFFHFAILVFFLLSQPVFAAGYLTGDSYACQSIGPFKIQMEELLKGNYRYKFPPSCLEIDGGYRFEKILKVGGGERIYKGKKTDRKCKTAFEKNCYTIDREFYQIKYLRKKYWIPASDTEIIK